jgi:hypothetical protein
MAYRNGTYVAFHAEGSSDFTATDMKYYNLLKAWNVHDAIDFEFVNSHDKTGSVRDSSKRATLEASLKMRLLRSKNMILIIGKTTKFDTDWVPFEIGYAVDECEIPIIAAYTGYSSILKPASHRSEWPKALETRIDNGTAHVIHIPFKCEALTEAVEQFTHDNLPKSGLVYYLKTLQQKWGYIA